MSKKTYSRLFNLILIIITNTIARRVSDVALW